MTEVKVDSDLDLDAPPPPCPHPEHRHGTRGGLRKNQRVCCQCSKVITVAGRRK